MKIASLLPSATEIVYALGLGDDLIGVTDECDFPADAVTKPVISRSALGQGPRPLSALEIDRAVRERMGAEQPLYVLDKELLRREQPDLILTQDLCRVCAVPTGHVEQALEELGTVEAKVLSLDPQSLEEVIAQIETVGKLVDREDRAAELTGTLRSRVARVKEIAVRLPTVTVFCLEWSEPPFVAGHWMPEMVELAGGVNLLNERGNRSVEIAWHEVRDAAPEVVIFMPCGYYLDVAEEEAQAFLYQAEFADAPAARNGNVFAVDATSFFSRPGPRLVDGLEILAWAIHPEAYPEPPGGTITRLK
ncbi:MAG: iron complex transport system substrate-binding protein [Actinomycetota bacterium]|nr:iron complex transport system substrate-binding protein [Actinomycetota bacterium]